MKCKQGPRARPGVLRARRRKRAKKKKKKKRKKKMRMKRSSSRHGAVRRRSAQRCQMRETKRAPRKENTEWQKKKLKKSTIVENTRCDLYQRKNFSLIICLVR